MMIGVASSKGGVGKSTIATHLAAWLHNLGYQVILADCDVQHSSSDWLREALPDIRAVHLKGPDQILDTLPALAKEADFVVADGPGGSHESSRAVLLRADLAVVPCKASMLEVRALAQATAVLRQAHEIRKGKPDAVIVLSMVGKNYRLTQDMKDAAEELQLRRAENPIILRQVYADAPGQKGLVWDLGARGWEASKEIELLFREILPDAYRSRKQAGGKKHRPPAAEPARLVDAD